MTYTPRRLSEKAFEELLVIVREEFGEQITDDDVEDIGIRLLQLYKFLATPDVSRSAIKMTESEARAVAFLQNANGNGNSPSIRNLCKAMGFRSSRSGFRLLNTLMSKGLVRRDDNGRLTT